MTNRPRQKGTAWETELLTLLRRSWPGAARCPLLGSADQGDFSGVPCLIEAKSTERPNFLAWARICRRKRPGRWVIAWHGDRRTEPEELALMPLDFALELLHHWNIR